MHCHRFHDSKSQAVCFLINGALSSAMWRKGTERTLACLWSQPLIWPARWSPVCPACPAYCGTFIVPVQRVRDWAETKVKSENWYYAMCPVQLGCRIDIIWNPAKATRWKTWTSKKYSWCSLKASHFAQVERESLVCSRHSHRTLHSSSFLSSKSFIPGQDLAYRQSF